MNPQVRTARPQANHCLLVEFTNGEQRFFDLNPYLHRGIFRHLRDQSLFERVRVVAGSVEWPGGIDLSYDTVYLNSAPVNPAPAPA